MAAAAVAAGITDDGLHARTSRCKYPNRAERDPARRSAAACATISPGRPRSRWTSSPVPRSPRIVIDRLDDDELRLLEPQRHRAGSCVEAPFAGWPVRLPKLDRRTGDPRVPGAVSRTPNAREAIQHNPDRLRDLVGRGALVQSNASSLLGDHGRLVTKTVELAAYATG